jgi:hypothetical protein
MILLADAGTQMWTVKTTCQAFPVDGIISYCRITLQVITASRMCTVYKFEAELKLNIA